MGRQWCKSITYSYKLVSSSIGRTLVSKTSSCGFKSCLISYIGMYLLCLISSWKSSWLQVSSILTIPTLVKKSISWCTSMVEGCSHKAVVESSSLYISTVLVAQSGRAEDCGSLWHGFKSHLTPTYWHIPSVLYTVERVIGCMWVQSPLPVLSWSTWVV